MTAALTIADAGYDVTLVEREDALGGNLRHIYYLAEGQNPQRLLRDLVNRVRGHDHIDVLTQAELVEHRGSVGRFASRVRAKGKEHVIQHGVTIVATGGQQSRDGRYQLGRNKRVVTQQDLEDIIAHRPEEIAAMKQVVMIQCVRQEGEIEYCSRICCTNTVKNAIRVKLLNPNCQVIVLYKDIITYGFREQYYTEARKRGVLFIRYTDETRPAVESLPDGRVQVKVHEPNLNREMTLHARPRGAFDGDRPQRGDGRAGAQARRAAFAGRLFHGSALEDAPDGFHGRGHVRGGHGALSQVHRGSHHATRRPPPVAR